MSGKSDYGYNLLQIENRYKKRYIKNTRETSIVTPGVKLSTVVIFTSKS